MGVFMKHKISTLTDQIVQPEVLLSKQHPDRLFIEVRLGVVPEDELKSYREGHIHGAVFAQIREVFASRPTLQTGNLPLPDISILERQLINWQVTPETEIIVYGPSMALAARAWWVLRWAGMKHVKVLDGGIKSWAACGGAVAQGDYSPPKKTNLSKIVLRPGQMPSISVDDVENLERSTLLIDARDESSFMGGSIPGAVNLPASDFWTPGSNLRTIDEVRALFDETKVFCSHDVVVYCGGGVLSALEVLLLNAFGVNALLFVGSWSEWNRCPRRMAKSHNTRINA